ncbi:MAG: hypothetical protein L0338_09465 [Acidobacteria bacterium]|nr:hypothetical protein [Acidobacteriota bacterium]
MMNRLALLFALCALPLSAAEPRCETWQTATVLSWSQESRPGMTAGSVILPVRVLLHRLRAEGDTVYTISGGKKPLTVGQVIEICLNEKEYRTGLLWSKKGKAMQVLLRTKEAAKPVTYQLVGVESKQGSGTEHSKE